MSKQVFMVCRQLIGANGTSLYVPLKAYAQESDAKAACKTMTSIFGKLAEGTIVVDGKPVTRVSNFFHELGVKEVSFNYVKSDVSESALVAVRPQIVLP
jgi:hypothetical protein